MAKSFLEAVKKYNKWHDPKTGRFTSGPGGSSGAVLTDENKSFLKRYTAGEHENACKMAQDIIVDGDCTDLVNLLKRDMQDRFWMPTDQREAGMKQIESDAKQAKEIMEVINKQPVTQDILVRVDSGIDNCSVGDTLLWGIRSTSRDENFAEKVKAREIEGMKHKVYSFDDTYLGMTVYKIVGDKKHLPIDDYSEFKDQKESLVSGKFKVVAVHEDAYNPPPLVKPKVAAGERFEPTKDRWGEDMVRDNQTGHEYLKGQFEKYVLYNGKLMAEYKARDEQAWERSRYKSSKTYEIEQVFED